jgi:hypothetical protein
MGKSAIVDRVGMSTGGPTADDEQPFADGNVNGATRVGDTVRRSTGPWTPAVHDLLAHLHARGLDGVPRVLGVDARGREILSYLPGGSVDVDAEMVSDDLLADAVGWLRRFHTAVATFRPAGVVQWRGVARSLDEDEIICHHDTGAYNWVVDGDRFVGMVDWDMAAPGRPVDDLAFLCWSSVPLFRPIPAPDVARRLRLVIEAYGEFSVDELTAAVDVRMTRATDRIQAGQAAGDPGMLNLANVGEPARTRAALAAFRGRMPEIAAALRDQ